MSLWRPTEELGRASEGLSLLAPAPGQDPQLGCGVRRPQLPLSSCQAAGATLAPAAPRPAGSSGLRCAHLPGHTERGGGAYQRGCKNELLRCINIFTLLSSH